MIALLMEAGLLLGMQRVSGYHFQPRGLGWIVMPIMVGTLGASYSVSVGDRLKVYLFALTKEQRLAIILTIAWIVVVVLYITLTKPYGRTITDDEYTSAIGWIFAPPVIGFAIWQGIKWALRGR